MAIVTTGRSGTMHIANTVRARVECELVNPKEAFEMIRDARGKHAAIRARTSGNRVRTPTCTGLQCHTHPIVGLAEVASRVNIAASAISA